MTTKLVVSFDALSISNLNSVITSRSIDEVIVVNSSDAFNNLGQSDRASIVTKRAALPNNVSLKLAFSDIPTAGSYTISNDFYDFISYNNISFFNDPGLSSVSSGLVLEAEAVTGTGSSSYAIDGSKLSNFSSTLAQNVLWKPSGNVTLGSSFGSKPNVTVSNPGFLSDLSGSISVTISAAKFATILENNAVNRASVDVNGVNVAVSAGNTIAATDPANFTITDTAITAAEAVPVNNQFGNNVEQTNENYSTNYNGSNRKGNLVGKESLTVSTDTDGYYFFSDTADFSLTTSQALRLPKMGVGPLNAGVMANKGGATVTLADNADNISAFLKVASEGQIASFHEIKLTNNDYLVLDAATFKKLDTASQNIPGLKRGAGGISSLKNLNGNNTDIYVRGSIADFTSAGLYLEDTVIKYSQSLKIDNLNLLAQIPNNQGIVLAESIGSLTDLTKVKTFLDNKPASITAIGTQLTLTAPFVAELNEGLTAAEFTSLVTTDISISGYDLFANNLSSGVKIVDTADNIKSLITSSNAALIPFKDYIKGISSTSNAQEKIQLSWDEYLGALSGTNFDANNATTYSDLATETAFKDLGNIELVVAGTAAEISTIIEKYTSYTANGVTINKLADFPAGLTFNILDGGEVTLTQAQLDKLDARIDGLVKISDTSAGVATLLQSAIPNEVKSIEVANSGTLEVTVDQFRNLPNFYNADLTILDDEDNIVKALSEDLLDDRVTQIVIATHSTTLGKLQTGQTTTTEADNALTVTAAAAANILTKKVYTSSTNQANGTTAEINIVDRASAIASFIENANVPGISTGKIEANKINFTEKFGGDIKLSYSQWTAYNQLKDNNLLVGTLHKTPTLSEYNLASITASLEAGGLF